MKKKFYVNDEDEKERKKVAKDLREKLKERGITLGSMYAPEMVAMIAKKNGICVPEIFRLCG